MVVTHGEAESLVRYKATTGSLHSNGWRTMRVIIWKSDSSMIEASFINGIFQRMNKIMPFEIVLRTGVRYTVRNGILEEHCIFNLKSSESHLIIIKIKLFTCQF